MVSDKKRSRRSAAAAMAMLSVLAGDVDSNWPPSEPKAPKLKGEYPLDVQQTLDSMYLDRSSSGRKAYKQYLKSVSHLLVFK